MTRRKRWKKNKKKKRKMKKKEQAMPFLGKTQPRRLNGVVTVAASGSG